MSSECRVWCWGGCDGQGVEWKEVGQVNVTVLHLQWRHSSFKQGVDAGNVAHNTQYTQ